MLIKLQHLSVEKEIEINSDETLDNLKRIIESLFGVPQEQQAVYFEDRVLTNSTKQLQDLGINGGCVLKIKKVKKIDGASESGMKALLKDPMLKNMMNSSTLESMKNMFPELKEQMEENSSLNMLINNGAMEEELSKFASNEDYANIQLRNNDVAMAKLEQIPGGFQIINNLSQETGNLNMIKPKMDLKRGSDLTSKPNQPLPGSNKKNLFIEFRKELLIIKQIGFDNIIDNITALQAANGDIDEAILILESKYKNK